MDSKLPSPMPLETPLFQRYHTDCHAAYHARLYMHGDKVCDCREYMIRGLNTTMHALVFNLAHLSLNGAHHMEITADPFASTAMDRMFGLPHIRPPPNAPEMVLQQSLLLQTLPGELLMQICDHLTPVDSILFGLSCKTVYGIHLRIHGEAKIGLNEKGSHGCLGYRLLDWVPGDLHLPYGILWGAYDKFYTLTRMREVLEQTLHRYRFRRPEWRAAVYVRDFPWMIVRDEERWQSRENERSHKPFCIKLKLKFKLMAQYSRMRTQAHDPDTREWNGDESGSSWTSVIENHPRKSPPPERLSNWMNYRRYNSSSLTRFELPDFKVEELI